MPPLPETEKRFLPRAQRPVAAGYDLISLRTDYGNLDGSGQRWILEIEKIRLLLAIAGAIN